MEPRSNSDQQRASESKEGERFHDRVLQRIALARGRSARSKSHPTFVQSITSVENYTLVQPLSPSGDTFTSQVATTGVKACRPRSRNTGRRNNSTESMPARAQKIRVARSSGTVVERQDLAEAVWKHGLRQK